MADPNMTNQGPNENGDLMPESEHEKLMEHMSTQRSAAEETRGKAENVVYGRPETPEDTDALEVEEKNIMSMNAEIKDDKIYEPVGIPGVTRVYQQKESGNFYEKNSNGEFELMEVFEVEDLAEPNKEKVAQLSEDQKQKIKDRLVKHIDENPGFISVALNYSFEGRNFGDTTISIINELKTNADYVETEELESMNLALESNIFTDMSKEAIKASKNRFYKVIYNTILPKKDGEIDYEAA